MNDGTPNTNHQSNGRLITPSSRNTEGTPPLSQTRQTTNTANTRVGIGNASGNSPYGRRPGQNTNTNTNNTSEGIGNANGISPYGRPSAVYGGVPPADTTPGVPPADTTPGGTHTDMRTGGFGAANLTVAMGRTSTTVVNALRVHDDGVYCSANPSLDLPPMPVRGNSDTYLPIFNIAPPPPGLTPDQLFCCAFWSWLWKVWQATACPPRWLLNHSILSRSVTIDEYHHGSRNFLATIAYCCVEGMNNRPPGRNVGSVAAMMNDPERRDTAMAMTRFISYVVQNFVTFGRNEVTIVSVQTANVFSNWASLRSKLKRYGYFGCHQVALDLPHANSANRLSLHQLSNKCRGLYINQYRLYRMIFRDFTVSRGNVDIPQDHLKYISPHENADIEQDVLLYNA